MNQQDIDDQVASIEASTRLLLDEMRTMELKHEVVITSLSLKIKILDVQKHDLKTQRITS